MVQRIVTGATLVAALVVLTWLGPWALAVVAFAAYARTIYEELNVLKLAKYRPVHWSSYAALVLSIPLVLLYSYNLIVPLLVGLGFCVVLQIMRREKPEFLDIAMSLLPMLTLVLPAMCMFGIIATQPRSLQIYLFALALGVPIAGDTAAYFVGSLLGRHKLCPAISPKKTVEGAAGGLVGSVLLALLCYAAFAAADASFALPPLWHTPVIGLAAGIGGQVGDLFASMIKRHCGVKDFSSLFPGHGGMLDRMDSINFSVMVVFCYRLVYFALNP